MQAQNQAPVYHQHRTEQVYYASEDDLFEHGHKTTRTRCQRPNDNTRTLATVKPAKFSIPEFEGDDIEHWIQTTEEYFDKCKNHL